MCFLISCLFSSLGHAPQWLIFLFPSDAWPHRSFKSGLTTAWFYMLLSASSLIYLLIIFYMHNQRDLLGFFVRPIQKQWFQDSRTFPKNSCGTKQNGSLWYFFVNIHSNLYLSSEPLGLFQVLLSLLELLWLSFARFCSLFLLSLLL